MKTYIAAAAFLLAISFLASLIWKDILLLPILAFLSICAQGVTFGTFGGAAELNFINDVFSS